jgi:hypothetical protein
MPGKHVGLRWRRSITDDAKCPPRNLGQSAAIRLKFQKRERNVEIDQGRHMRRGANMKWWTVVALAVAAAGWAVFPSAVHDVWADRPENEGRTEANLDEIGGKTRDSGVPVLPIYGGGARAAVAAPATGDGLSVAHVELPDGRQQTTVIDIRTRTMAVYHIDPRTGVIALKSVRNLGWDLQIDDYNSGKPQPREIRALVERR